MILHLQVLSACNCYLHTFRDLQIFKTQPYIKWEHCGVVVRALDL